MAGEQGTERELRDALQEAVTAMRGNADAMQAQREKLGAVESLLVEKDQKLQARIDQLTEEMNKLAARLNRTPTPGEDEGAAAPGAMAQYEKALVRFLRRGDDSGLGDRMRAAYAPDGEKALSVGSDPDGGYLVTPTMANRIISRIFDTSPMRQYAAVQPITTDALEGTVDRGEVNAGWVTETGARASTGTAQIGQYRIPVHEIYAFPMATQKLLDDAGVNVEQWLSDKVADKFARMQNAAFVSGDGAGKPRGFLTYAAGTNWQQIQQVNTGVADNVGADGLLDLVYSLQSAYRAGAIFAMNRATLGEVRKLKDSTSGMYVWQPGLQAGQPSNLLGFPVAEFDDMPDVGAGALAVAFGNFREAYQIVDRIGIRVLRDAYTNKPYVGFYTTARVGGDVVNFDAIKLQKCST